MHPLNRLESIPVCKETRKIQRKMHVGNTSMPCAGGKARWI